MGMCNIVLPRPGGSFMAVAETWAQYVARMSAGLTHAQIAAKTGGVVSMSNVGRWLRGELTNPGADHVIAFATGFNISPIEALAVAGYLDPEAVMPPTRTPISAYTMAELLDELRRRTVAD